MVPVTPLALTPRELLDRIRDASSLWIQERTVSILIEGPNRELTQHGTGVLLAVADSVFLISAAHVLREAQHQHLWINAVAMGPNLIPLAGVEINTTDDLHAVDFGFVRLSDASLEELKRYKKFVRLNEIDLEPSPPRGLYSAFGYPTEINAQLSKATSIPTTGVFYGTRLHDWARSLKLENFDHSLNIALEFAPQRSTDARGFRARVPYPGGMSGCGLWRLHRFDAKPQRWTQEDIRLAGIQHTLVSHGSEAALVGVRFSHIFWTLRRAFPELRQVFDLYAPGARPPSLITRDVR